jgi:hypothetical protein
VIIQNIVIYVKEGFTMTDEKVEDAITHLELAIQQIETFHSKCECEPGSEALVYSISLIKEVLSYLREFEIKNEIDSFSEPE